MLDILFSVPLASYFFLGPSAMTSWSTSLNLLFFYMTWSTLILSQPPLTVHLVGTLSIRLVVYLLPSLVTLLFDVGVPSLADSVKFNGRQSLPPRDAKKLGRLLAIALGNLVLFTGVEGGISMLFTLVTGQPEFKTSTTLPLPWQIAKHVLGLFTAREVLTFYIHRYMHSASTRVAKLHRQYSHQQACAPFSLLLFTDHPVPLLLHRFVPIYLPALVLRPHLLTYLLFTLLCTAEETLAMSGYSVVPGFIMGGIVRRSAAHYTNGGRGNYGAWGFLDWAHATSTGSDVIDDVKHEAEKHRVGQRARGKASQGVNMIKGAMNGDDDEEVSLRRSPRKRPSRKAA